jgi:uncharacterized protein YbaR (Trm112 family)
MYENDEEFKDIENDEYFEFFFDEDKLSNELYSDRGDIENTRNFFKCPYCGQIPKILGRRFFMTDEHGNFDDMEYVLYCETCKKRYRIKFTYEDYRVHFVTIGRKYRGDESTEQVDHIRLYDL